MKTDLLLKLVTEFYGDKDIEEAKKLLFQHLPSHQNVKRNWILTFRKPIENFYTSTLWRECLACRLKVKISSFCNGVLKLWLKANRVFK